MNAREQMSAHARHLEQGRGRTSSLRSGERSEAGFSKHEGKAGQGDLMRGVADNHQARQLRAMQLLADSSLRVSQFKAFTDDNAASPRMAAQHTALAAMVGTGKPVSTGNSPAIQMKTEVKHTEQTLSGMGGKNGATYYSTLAGKTMNAKLDPLYPIKGSEPGSLAGESLYKALKSQWNEVFIKGHLLNDNLGGLGVAENLFPITSKANHAHLTNVEEHAKQAVVNLEKRVINDESLAGSYVEYNVEAKPAKANDFINKPNAKFICNVVKKLNDDMESEESVVDNEVIDSAPAQPSIDGLNDKLEDSGWGSVGSGGRSGHERVELKGSDKNGYYAILTGGMEYKKWKLNSAKTSWSLVQSDEQRPVVFNV